ncbi:hypothetical protein [Streptomyces sp. NPDC004134]|uniref:hypothetical protein n=1 Tax=Streptomyces sp. NPDC004134 TaxID=3364691 RepID=UPI0036C25C7B
MSVRPRRFSSLVVPVLCAASLCVLFQPAVASAQSSGGGVGSASGAAGRYIDPGMSAGASMGATTTVSGGFSASTGITTGVTTTSGGTGPTTTGGGGGGWGSVLFVAGVVLVCFLAGRAMRLIGAVRRRRGH